MALRACHHMALMSYTPCPDGKVVVYSERKLITFDKVFGDVFLQFDQDKSLVKANLFEAYCNHGHPISMILCYPVNKLIWIDPVVVNYE